MSTAVLPAAEADETPLEPYVNVVVTFAGHRIADWTGPASEGGRIAKAWGVRYGVLAEVKPLPDVELAARAGVAWE